MCTQAREAQGEQGAPQPRGVAPWSWEPAQDKLCVCPAVRGGDEALLPGPAPCQLHLQQPTRPPPACSSGSLHTSQCVGDW